MTSLNNIQDKASSRRRWLPALLFGALSMTSAAVVVADEGFGGDSSGGDPTVGTLPMTGGEGVDLDQTVTLRGATELIRSAIVKADGDGGVEVIDLGTGESWVRFYGDVELELDLSILVGLELGIFGGFEGGGSAFAVETVDGVGSPFGLESGFSLEIEVGRLVSEGLVDSLMEIHAYHRSGRRTSTGIELNAAGDRLQILQQI
ncbi:hypothetical protein OAV47_01755 [bacterium]|nr:hypothetical protein [bacterium]